MTFISGRLDPRNYFAGSADFIWLSGWRAAARSATPAATGGATAPSDGRSSAGFGEDQRQRRFPLWLGAEINAKPVQLYATTVSKM